MQSLLHKPGIWGFVSVIVSAVLCLPVEVIAQNATGSLEGEVQDDTHARVPAASVTVQSVGTSLERQVITDGRGDFRFDDLMPGRYQLLVNATGFAEARSEVIVLVSSVRDVLVTLRPSAVQQSVSVGGEASSITTQVLDTTDAVNGGVVTGQDLENIPSQARSFANIAYM
ncbi:MAG TPA: carboxypeptidase-like regulatory domain-containing protein, partial [Terriglobales bacterium]